MPLERQKKYDEPLKVRLEEQTHSNIEKFTVGVLLNLATLLVVSSANGSLRCELAVKWEGFSQSLGVELKAPPREKPFERWSVSTAKTIKSPEVEYQVEVPHRWRRDQCHNGCAPNAFASYLEILLAHHGFHVELSANYLWARAKLLEAQEMLSGFLKEQKELEVPVDPLFLLRNLNLIGLSHEKDFKSRNDVDLYAITELLNKVVNGFLDIKKSISRNKNRSEEEIEAEVKVLRTKAKEKLVAVIEANFDILPNKETVFEKQNLDLTAGDIIAKFLEVPKTELYGFNRFLGRVNEQSVAEGFKPGFLVTYIESNLVNLGLPLLLGYRHRAANFDRSTDSYSNEVISSSSGEWGHAALIVGVSRNSGGEITHLKILNSHAKTPFLNMPIEYFVENVDRIYSYAN